MKMSTFGLESPALKEGLESQRKQSELRSEERTGPEISSKGPSSSVSTVRAKEFEVRPLACAWHPLVSLVFSPVRLALSKSNCGPEINCMGVTGEPVRKAEL